MSNKFEEQFPSLMRKERDGDYTYLASVYDDSIDCQWIRKDMEGYDYVDKDGVQKHCLDKQTVREAIKNHLLIMQDLPVNRKFIFGFIKELGLDNVSIERR